MKVKNIVLCLALLTLLLVGCSSAPVKPTVRPISKPTDGQGEAPTAEQVATAPVEPTATVIPGISGTLTNIANNEAFNGARITLCEFVGENTCAIRPEFTDVTDAEGSFHIEGMEPGTFIVLYNASGEQQDAWDGMTIDLTIKEGESVIHSVMRSLDVEELTACDLKLGGEGLDFTFSGNLYSAERDIAMILMESGLYAVSYQKGATFDTSVWSTLEEECETVYVLSLQENGKINIDTK